MQNPTLEFIEKLARQAGHILRDGYDHEHTVGHKGVIDLVTEVDHQSEAYLLEEVHTRFPQHAILAEESGSLQGSADHQWYIDPLDGTVNYAHGIPIFCVSIAFAWRGQLQLAVIYDPMRDECFSAELNKGASLNGKPIKASSASRLVDSLLVTGFPYDTWNTNRDNFNNFVHFGKLTQGVRRLGSAALDLCYVAAGRFDGYWELSLKAWDVAAGGLIAREAGALVTDIHGGPDFISDPQSILASAQALHPLMLAELARDNP